MGEITNFLHASASATWQAGDKASASGIANYAIDDAQR
jgi:hypothetical protein